tara:strand:- start:1156 stop:1662 length:507 start_codon:yes stop_codon:yes gene_type:complete
MNIETRLTRWSPIKALGKVQNEIADMGVPSLKVDLDEREHLEFSDLMNTSNRDLEEFLIVYGGYKAYLETRIADVKAKRSALSAAFDEGYATALSRIAQEREDEGKKKLTREEIRGVALDNYPQLKELRQEIIEQEALEIQTDGLLNTYTTAYNTVSRIVTLRIDKSQ